ncbi:MAG: hypothetical protein E6614_34535, partial [Bradyrhizobium sp.]|nr:hypothetical protein [Bradyrhizobium sp.]
RQRKLQNAQPEWLTNKADIRHVKTFPPQIRAAATTATISSVLASACWPCRTGESSGQIGPPVSDLMTSRY